ncbi:MAG TPA: 1,2-phenylacetyl-CoA epoxidase subunit PaaD [Candidatus Dormibacteraeota bacterium]|nr:1,2-phenylacetyl-CoA epoxidase subunit PaaD [Candidatus Dormibacteraeota bacterium]
MTATAGRKELAARVALLTVMDPEIPSAQIVEMGMVHAVREEDGEIVVEIIPTFSGCPAIAVIEQEVRAALAGAGVSPSRVVLRADLPWSTDSISEAGRRQLTEHGLVPPQRGRLRAEEISCPQCRQRQVILVSRFGATPCRAIARCNGCGEPLELFKPIGSVDQP